MNVPKAKSFDELAEYYLRRAIASDLQFLLGDRSTSPPDAHSRSTSNDRTPLMSSVSCSSLDSALKTSHTLRKFSEVSNFPYVTNSIANTVCQVQFKHVHRNYMLPDALLNISIGEFVVVQSFVDKSLEDLGVVTALFTSERFAKMRAMIGPSEDADENKVGKVLRVATVEERQLLPLKAEKEVPLLSACQYFSEQMKLDLCILGAEYQFDGKVLFVYYSSVDRVDYREFVHQIIRLCCNKKTRVQMKKKTSSSLVFEPRAFAANALATGQYQQQLL